MLEKLKKFKWGYVVIFLVLLAIGICLISLKETLTVLAITIGVSIALFGIIFGTVVIAKKGRGIEFALKIIFASMCLIAGVVAAIFKSQSIEIIISISSLLLIIDAALKIKTTAMAKRYSVPLWWIILALSLLTIIGGFFMLKYTPEKIETASIVLGIVFIVDSVSNLLSAFYVTAYEKRELAEHYREFYRREIAPRAKAAFECESEEEIPEEESVTEESAQEPLAKASAEEEESSAQEENESSAPEEKEAEANEEN